MVYLGEGIKKEREESKNLVEYKNTYPHFSSSLV